MSLSSRLIRWAGLAAALAGMLFIAIQTIHPVGTLAAVTTPLWALAHYMTFAMCLLGMLGLTGLYARQVDRAGWLGLAGYLLFGLWLAVTAALVFVEAAVLPLLVRDAPGFVEGVLSLSGSPSSKVELGPLAMIASGSGLLYLSGGLLFGLASFRARVLPRGASALFGLGAVSALAFAVLPHEFERLAAVPAGLGLIWLGLATLLSPNRKEEPTG